MQKERRNKGFVLIEVIAVLSIVVAILGIIGIDPIGLKANKKQNLADETAKQIFISAQTKIKELYTANEKDLLNSKQKFTYKPSDYKGNDNLLYIYSFDEDIDRFCDDFVEDGLFVIEYNPNDGEVFGVFYSTNKLVFYSREKDDDLLRNYSYEEKKDFAKEKGYNISYYSESIANTDLEKQD